MPSEKRKPKEDTWTTAELNRALKGSKDDMHRRKRKDDDSDRRQHRDNMNGADYRRDDDRRSHHREEEDKRIRHHKDRGDSPDHVALTEEDREKLRQERRAKREGRKEVEKKPSKLMVAKPIKNTEDDERKQRKHRDHSEGYHGDRKQKHRSGDRDRERRHQKTDHQYGDREHRRSHDDDGDDDRTTRHPKIEGSSPQRHRDKSDKPRHQRSDDMSRHHDRKTEEDDEEEREKRRQKRKEKREKEHGREKGRDRQKEDTKHGRHDKDVKDNMEERRRQSKGDRVRGKNETRHERERVTDQDRNLDRRNRAQIQERETESEKRRHEVLYKSPSHSAGDGGHTTEEDEKAEEEKDDYNYEEDFEDYEDDFEEENDPEVKEGGEMEEILRALDEENNRLVSASHRSNWSDSTDLSDERFKDEGPAPKGCKTFINFVSAKQRVMDRTLAGKALKRFEDLSKLIELDVAKYDMFDLPPVKEYELYIHSFGRSDTKQAYVQTRDDDIDRDIQTEEIECLSKWTQHPPDADTAVGGEGINVQASDTKQESAKKTDPAKLNQFLERVGQYLFMFLDEESKSTQDEERRRDQSASASFSDSASQLGMPNFLQGRQVISLSFCCSEPNYLLSVHTSEQEDTRENHSPLQSMSILCVWNISQLAYPYRICGSQMQITCACFSPTKASLIFGGMYDGSVALWDLREPASSHRNFKVNGQEHLVRFPTYNTAAVNEPENHHSPVVSIVPVYSNIVGSLKDEEAAESSSGLSFQLASVEEKSVVNLWVVAEIAHPDPAGTEHDLGLSPGGKIKLLRSSSIVLTNPNKYSSKSSELKALDLHLNPGDLNHFYVATDVGCIVHGVRFGNRAYPQSHSLLADSPVPVVSLDFSPFGQPYFLAGYQDGTLHLFNSKLENPIATWREFVSGDAILCVRWSRSRPVVFFVLDNNSTLFTFDLIENGLAPIKMDRITVSVPTKMELGGDPNLMTPGLHKPAYMVLALDNGTTEVLTISDAMRQQQPLEEDFLATYVDRY